MFFLKSDPKKIKICVFLLALLTLIFGASPKVILPIGQTLLKSDPCPVYLKKMFCLPTNPILFLKKLEAQWAEPVSLTCRTNQKQELPMAAMCVNRSERNDHSL
jgi:hypothetical protein